MQAKNKRNPNMGKLTEMRILLSTLHQIHIQVWSGLTRCHQVGKPIYSQVCLNLKFRSWTELNIIVQSFLLPILLHVLAWHSQFQFQWSGQSPRLPSQWTSFTIDLSPLCAFRSISCLFSIWSDISSSNLLFVQQLKNRNSEVVADCREVFLEVADPHFLLFQSEARLRRDSCLQN